jgi:hypothetical protein
MSTLQELLPDLEQGAILVSSRGESIRPLGGGRFEWLKARGYRFEQEFVTMAELRQYNDVWDWSVLTEREKGGE